MVGSVEFHDLVIVVSTGTVRILLNGLYFSPGILFVAFRDDLHATSGVTAWVTSLHYFTFCLLSAIGGCLMKRLSSRVVAIAGGVVMICGLVSSMFASHIAHVFITYGIITGGGSGLVHIGCIAALHYYLRRRRDLYFGICSFIETVGVAGYAPMLQYLIDTYTWRGTFLILAGLQLNSLAVALLFPCTHIAKQEALCIEEDDFQHLDRTVMAPDAEQTTNKLNGTDREKSSYSVRYQIHDRDEEENNVDLIKWKEAPNGVPIESYSYGNVDKFYSCVRFLGGHSFLKTCQYQRYLLSAGLFYFGAGIMWGHIVAYSVVNGISDKMGASVYYTINMVTMSLARFAHAVVLNTGRVRALTIHMIFCGVSGLATFILLWDVPYVVVCVYVAILGPGGACLGGAVAPAIVLTSSGMNSFEVGFGLYILATGAGYLIGAPVAGWIFDMTRSYRIPFALAGVTMTLSSVSVMGFFRRFKCACTKQ